jgi:hypothetical protein
VDYKSLKLPADAIGRARKTSYAATNCLRDAVRRKRTGRKSNQQRKAQQILTDFLKSRGFEQPREKADLIIKQLRDRNFILCFLGDEYYAFVHRTFLDFSVPGVCRSARKASH